MTVQSDILLLLIAAEFFVENAFSTFERVCAILNIARSSSTEMLK